MVAGVPAGGQAMVPPHLPAAGLHRGHQAGGLLLVAADSNITYFIMTMKILAGIAHFTGRSLSKYTPLIRFIFKNVSKQNT